jgi:hypothetical protein
MAPAMAAAAPAQAGMFTLSLSLISISTGPSLASWVSSV